MVSSLLHPSLPAPPQAALISANKCPVPSQGHQEKCCLVISCRSEPEHAKLDKNGGRGLSFSRVSMQGVFHKSVVPLAASIAVLVGANPAHAGLLSGFPGIESVPGPQLPQVDFLNRFNEENQKMYAENDARFKDSPLLKKLLERSKLNKEKNKQEIMDKYCLRGAEWGVGDCSTEGMSPDERDKFIAMLKQKAGVQ
ncbi:uncharacterized protein LOC127245326 [Andrographis paniculata]|uniref:uncharacterized protein LOC127245326 n=1 Tax=Andrographis paniculata TaxID=175694 RepID=UPI0021E84A5E|nr:uncharacterized protein LOC127245326 [Andrographis paniculata]